MLGAVIITAVLLCLGVALRTRFRLFAAARIPASLLAGTIGLVVFQCMVWLFWSDASSPAAAGTTPAGVESFFRDSIANLRQWPAWLIAVVFAGMLLSRSPARREDEPRNSVSDDSKGFSPVAREALMVWIIVVGQTAIGLLLVWWWIGPQYSLPASAGMLIETGFAGGHGTAAAMGTVLAHPSIGMDNGLDLGVLMATSGLIYGLVSGIFWIEVGVRCGWLAPASAHANTVGNAAAELPADAGNLNDAVARGAAEDNSIDEGCPRPPSDAIDPLLLQLLWLMLAFVLGLAMQYAVDQLAATVDAAGWFAPDRGETAGEDILRDRLRVGSVVGSFPLFIYTLFGGAVVRFCVIAAVGEHWIDHQRIQRLVGSSMDLLVVAAVATLNLAVVAALWVPLFGLFLGGAIWSTFCLLVLSRKILPAGHWFELGLINFGMSTGTTATGFVLLRVVDPDLETPAAKQYALAAPLSAPFIGGGMITVGLPLLVLERVPIGFSALAVTAVLIGLVTWGVSWKSRITAAAASANARTRSPNGTVAENR
ncbi:sodium/glutamate symporter family protein [Allorhodopirellula solitaria]|uniref:Sodium/glutamate symporter n=1 Tax=Allorhodopirellula solitaria TaxID=2527987 RepID=A0A5C5XVI4_9BACT|nr:sodium:glutamate symporter [Allorhodopirellula solitaria]TWT66413.1 hypothetical protein CA85_25070 [Allorhodopirellula solitaria]